MSTVGADLLAPAPIGRALADPTEPTAPPLEHQGAPVSAHKRPVRVFPAVALVALAFGVTACGDDSDSGGGAGDVPDVESAEPIPDARCEANRAAGTITYLSSFDFAAAASIVEVLVAEERGYFDELCLDVDIQPSFSTANYPLVAANDAQFSSGGSFSEIVTFGQSCGRRRSASRASCRRRSRRCSPARA
jgi:hypothetical protein